MQRHSITRAAAAALAVLTLSACAGGNYRAVADSPVRIGPAYTIRGATYVPAAAPGYDALGYASWYGSASGNRTANGEKFRPGRSEERRVGEECVRTCRYRWSPYH